MVRQSLSLRPALQLLLALLLAACTTPGPQAPAPAGEGQPLNPDGPPPIPREFRAAWVATVGNIDWPSKPGLPVAEQQAEIDKIVARAKELNLNALIVQVRPAADALYASTLEPWSEYLTGVQGLAPEPFYDPLEYWVRAAHAQGIELHAWFNPYRARHNSAKSTNAFSHIANTHPEIVKDYGGYQWMDPGEPLAEQRTLDVITDVTRRYDIDGVHIDDYFYPYPVTTKGGDAAEEIDFPDGPSWIRYIKQGGTLVRADWRRQNVDRLIERIYQNVHHEKAWVRFGVSPFGLGRPDRRPPGISGFSQYDKLYADVEGWLARGWMDYLVPQLYWPIDQAPQAFGVLQQYWLTQNPLGRGVWPGMFTSRIDDSAKSWQPAEILDQINLTRARSGALGHAHFSMAALLQNRKGIADQLKASAYITPAVIPAAPWLGQTQLSAPWLAMDRSAETPQTLNVHIEGLAGTSVWKYAVWAKRKDGWQFSVLPARQNDREHPGRADYASENKDELSSLIVTPIDRYGNEGPHASLTAAQIARTR